MRNHVMQLRRPLLVLAATLAAATVWMSSAAPSASAQGVRQCNWIFATSTACIYAPVSLVSSFSYDVPMLLDVEMPGAYASSIVNNCGSRTFKAELWGDDGGGSDDDRLTTASFVKPGTFFAGPDFLHSEYLFPAVPRATLNDDSGTEMDELYGKISFVDCHTGQTRTFRTANYVTYIP